jgi:hypothetical protein
VGRTFTNLQPHSQPDAYAFSLAEPDADAATHRHAHASSDTYPDSATYGHAHANSFADADAYPDSDAVTTPHRDADAASNPYSDAGSNALTQSHTVAVSNAHSNAVASPDGDAYADADYRRYGAARWQGRRLLPRLGRPKWRHAALSHLCKRGRVAAGIGAEQLQRRHYRDAGRGGGHAVHGLRHRPRPRFGGPELSDPGHSIVSASRIASIT